MEAARLAYAMRDTFVADPDMADVPVEHMLGDARDRQPGRPHRPQEAQRQARADARGRPAPTPSTSPSSTTKGMAVSFINSLYDEFGSGIVTAKTGVIFHNRGKGFVLDPKHPNCIAPAQAAAAHAGSRHGHARRRGGMAFGVMGAHFQPIGPRLRDDQPRRLRHGPAGGHRLPRACSSRARRCWWSSRCRPPRSPG